jgi:teichuronic acid biosynthesis glycosyltransferase TuaH
VKIVAFPYHDWRKADAEGHRWRDIHLIDAFANHPDVERILVIDRPVSLAERLLRPREGWARGRTVAERSFPGGRARITEVTDRTMVLDIHVRDLIGPIVLRRGWWFRTFAQPRVQDCVRWAVAEMEMGQPSVVAWTPTVAPAVLALDRGAVVFDSLDNWMIHPRLRRDARAAGEAYADLLPAATAVVASAPASRAVLERWVDHVLVLPNGVNPELFGKRYERPVDLPTGAIVGYAGSLASRIDTNLVLRTASALPEVSFVFVGPIFEPSSIRPLRNLPNVHFLGNRHYDRVPSYIAHFDVAWIPHAVGEGETGGDPIKMYEYWAANREVVASRIDGLDAWADRLHLVDGAESAIHVIRGLLDGSIDARHASVPAERTWDAIAAHLIGIMKGRPDQDS